MGDGGAAVADPEIHRLGAIERGALRPVAIVERPGAGGADRYRPGQPDDDRVIDRCQIAFLDVVARTGLADAAGKIDAKPVHGVSRPAATVALDSQCLLRGQNAAAAANVGVQLEVPFFAEQPEPVADLPGDLQGAVGCGLRRRGGERQCHERAGKQRESGH